MKTKDIALIGVLAGSLKVCQIVLAFLPNIEVVSLLILIFSIRLGVKKAIYITTIYSTINMMIWGINPASIGYFGAWGVFVLICSFLKNYINNEIKAAVILGLFGLSFGFLFAIGYLPFDKSYALSFWINGLTFDIVHCVSNFIIGIWAFKPVLNGFDKAYKQIYKSSCNNA